MNMYFSSILFAHVVTLLYRQKLILQTLQTMYYNKTYFKRELKYIIYFRSLNI